MSSIDSTEFVVTGPGRFGTALAAKTRARSTLGVLTLLLAEAQHDVVISAPYLQDRHGLSTSPLQDALRSALARGVDISIMTTKQGLESLDIPRLRSIGRGKVHCFRPVMNVAHEKRLGSHAKFWIADGERAYVGSANLTRPGLTEHLEMGLLVRGTVAQQMRAFWDYCVQIGLFQLVERKTNR